MTTNPKITSKNLSYNSTLPPFLQRLQSAHSNAGLDGRHERAIARPRRARTTQDEEDDTPTYVDEQTGDVLGKEEYAALVGGEENIDERKEFGSDQDREASAPIGVARADREKQRITGIGAVQKRKVGKVLGLEEDVEANKDTTDPKARNEADGKAGETVKKAAAAKAKKNVKKIKLSFNDDEGS
ncbi:MAG: hypothetical protein M1818_007285 [Claussenomyces sp. TS43310]|nr:MAG: hypothetical protein M1818_007285 [Claussenomyces sp. TS43310]